MSASDVVRLVDIRDVPLDVAEVVDSLDDHAAGGLTLFVGKVRDHDGPAGSPGEGPAPDKPVTSLDYSAHPTALARMREVCERIAEEYDVHGVAVPGEVHLDAAMLVGPDFFAGRPHHARRFAERGNP